MSGASAPARSPLAKEDPAALRSLALIGAGVIALTVAAPFAFKAGGDNAFIAVAIPTALLALAATSVAERTSARRTLWLVAGVAIVLRIVGISFPPLLSTDIYRYIWDGTVQAAGINPYRFVPADPLLAVLRDPAIYPLINRATYAPTIYPPVAQAFFLLVTRFGANTLAMRFGLLACEAGSVIVILLLLRRLQRPQARVVAYLWHPLPVWEIANSGHVDGLMVFLMLLGIWLALTGRAVRGAVAVALAALAKPLALPALAVIWRPWNWTMMVAVVATVGVCYAPYMSVGWGIFGFLTKGYLAEEGLASGNGLWLLSLWRLAFGIHRGDVAVYLCLGALLLSAMVLAIWRRRQRTVASDLAGINVLLLTGLMLLSPEYPWYFLVLVPFVALCGTAPTWAASIGAILLTNEVESDFFIPAIITKSVLFGAVLLSALWMLWTQRGSPREGAR